MKSIRINANRVDPPLNTGRSQRSDGKLVSIADRTTVEILIGSDQTNWGRAEMKSPT